MTEIRQEHVEWVFVDRLREMLERPAEPYKTSETYALFTSILCWTMQHLRLPDGRAASAKDRAVQQLYAELRQTAISAAPWNVPVIADAGAGIGDQPGEGNQPARGFEHHSIARLLENLRNAVAHGDGRTIETLNRRGQMIGFRFMCQEKEDRRVVWRDQITLRQSDMRRIGCELAGRYCEAVKGAAPVPGAEAFEADARTVREADG